MERPRLLFSRFSFLPQPNVVELENSENLSAVENAFFIVGPTASGKSELAADVAQRVGAEIVNADAFQIYRGLPLLTAQPNESILARARHHLIATVSLGEEMNAAKFRKLALHALAEIRGRGKPALVVGGSGLYLKALTHGLAAVAPIDAQLRAKLNALSLMELNACLDKIESLGAKQVDRKNRRRVVRALELFAQMQQARASFSEWKKPTAAAGVFVFRDRAELLERINRRVEEMFRAGVVEEVANVGELGATAAKTLGFAPIQELLAGKITIAECIAAIQQATRRYAKRQLTWFRHQTNFDPLNLSLLKDHPAVVDSIVQKAEQAFATPE